MVVDLNMFRVGMKNRARSQVYGRNIVGQENYGGREGKTNSQRNDCIRLSSVVALAKFLCSDSVLERVIMCCFLKLHEIRFRPREIAKPPIEWSIDHPSYQPSQCQGSHVKQRKDLVGQKDHATRSPLSMA